MGKLKVTFKEFYTTLLTVCIFAICSIGWYMNLYKIFDCELLSWEIIYRIMGVLFCPLGMIFGYV